MASSSLREALPRLGEALHQTVDGRMRARGDKDDVADIAASEDARQYRDSRGRRLPGPRRSLHELKPRIEAVDDSVDLVGVERVVITVAERLNDLCELLALGGGHG